MSHGEESRRLNIRETTVEWICSHPWEWVLFATLTFPDNPHPERADKQYRVFWNTINRAVYGGSRTWYKRHPGICGIRAEERTKAGRIHYHCMYGGEESKILHRLDTMHTWEVISGGFARIEAIRSTIGVSAYCTKYLLKENEIDFSDSFMIYSKLGPVQRLALATKAARPERVDPSALVYPSALLSTTMLRKASVSAAERFSRNCARSVKKLSSSAT